MKLDHLPIFQKVVESGSLSKASKMLGIPKSKISRNLDTLEYDLQIKLLHRTPRGIILTEQGADFLKAIKAPLQQIDHAQILLQNQTNQLQGKIRFTAPEDLALHQLDKLISDFQNEYPHIRVELLATNQFVDFNNMNIDFALRIGKLPDSDLIQKRIADIEVILVATPEYLKINPEVIKLSDLNQHDFLMITGEGGERLNQTLLKEIQPKVSSNSIPIIKDLVLKSKGIALLPKFFCFEELKSGELTQILSDFSYLKRSLFLLAPRNQYIPEAAKLFRNYLFENLKTNLQLKI